MVKINGIYRSGTGVNTICTQLYSIILFVVSHVSLEFGVVNGGDREKESRRTMILSSWLCLYDHLLLVCGSYLGLKRTYKLYTVTHTWDPETFHCVDNKITRLPKVGVQRFITTQVAELRFLISISNHPNLN